MTYNYDGSQLRREDWSNSDHSFTDLAEVISSTHDAAQTYAVRAINRVQTMRNWLIGYYIVEFEQHGKDRAVYGSNLLQALEKRVNRKGLNITLFKNARRFYVQYPQIARLFSVQNSPTASDTLIEAKSPTVSDFLADADNADSNMFVTSAERIISLLSFSHICELLTVDDSVSRYFYEQECMRCTWSVRELRRQISTNLFARMGMSSNPEKMLSLSKSGELDSNELQIRQPFTFEFLGLKAQEVIGEHDLEDALIAHLQDFMLELGKGFCFEARQPRVVIDDEYYYPDLVFYNRILHCHVIIELKNEVFSHESLGQLNAYVSYYKENEMREGDNPPIGILMCTYKGKKMVEYALAGMDNTLFVSTYMLQLPDRATLERFLQEQLYHDSSINSQAAR